MSKKLSAVLAVLMVAVFVFFAVASNSKGDEKKADAEADKKSVQSDSLNDEEKADAEADKNSAQSNSSNKEKITFTELVVVDNEECFMKITGVVPDNPKGYALTAQLENRSADITYNFYVFNASVNGVDTVANFEMKVEPGKKADGKIIFYAEELKEIGEFTDIELSFGVCDSNDLFAANVASETVHIYPYGEDKATNFVRQAQATDKVIVDNDSVTVIVTGYKKDPVWGYVVKLFLVNKTDNRVMFTVNDASVNGIALAPLGSNSVSAGNSAFGSVSWLDEFLKESSISNIEEIKFNLRAYAYDGNDVLSDDFVNENVTLNP